MSVIPPPPLSENPEGDMMMRIFHLNGLLFACYLIKQIELHDDINIECSNKFILKMKNKTVQIQRVNYLTYCFENPNLPSKKAAASSDGYRAVETLTS